MRPCQEGRLLILVTKSLQAGGLGFSYTMGSLSHSQGIQWPKVKSDHWIMQCYVPVCVELHEWPWGAGDTYTV